MCSPLVGPGTAEEQNLSPTTTNEFMNPNATKIPRESILALFPTEQVWRNVSASARESSCFHRKSVIAQVLHLSCLKNCVVPELLQRGNLLVQGAFPFSAMSQDIVENQHAWIAWAVSLDDTIANVLKQITWLDLLEEEYVSVDPLWINFWRLHQECEQSTSSHPPSVCTDTEQTTPPSTTLLELEEIYTALARHNRRRLFLQMKMMQGRGWTARLFEPVPPWIHWEEVVRNILSAGMREQFHHPGLAREQETGFVEEIEEEEEEEDEEEEEEGEFEL
ncbi:hypothetical protein AYO21_10227 [Fonsecaea monophora]|uniref:Uncharacterized protein n=1 Tax=Fonsecaea monophora TaxID=254056 RepID=A0A177EWF7_9EURO|nr:hypothetical protein AYO21_10227 [Fonsecaea monophora]OAG35620.1 hypothetical protein AYO21_10227 [Fonsecaea monophora]